MANAAAAGFDLTQIARLGVDVLVFGGAKAGANCAEAIVLFDKSLARRLDNRLKQAGQTASKTRFLSAPILGLLESGAWEGGAAHANLMALRLAAGIATRSASTEKSISTASSGRLWHNGIKLSVRLAA